MWGRWCAACSRSSGEAAQRGAHGGARLPRGAAHLAVAAGARRLAVLLLLLQWIARPPHPRTRRRLVLLILLVPWAASGAAAPLRLASRLCRRRPAAPAPSRLAALSRLLALLVPCLAGPLHL